MITGLVYLFLAGLMLLIVASGFNVAYEKEKEDYLAVIAGLFSLLWLLCWGVVIVTLIVSGIAMII